MPQRACTLKVNYSLKVHDAKPKLFGISDFNFYKNANKYSGTIIQGNQWLMKSHFMNV